MEKIHREANGFAMTSVHEKEWFYGSIYVWEATSCFLILEWEDSVPKSYLKNRTGKEKNQTGLYRNPSQFSSTSLAVLSYRNSEHFAHYASYYFPSLGDSFPPQFLS